MTLEIEHLSDTALRILRAEAARHNTDIATFAKELILQGLQQRLESEPGFDVFSGLWSAEEAAEFEAATAQFSELDQKPNLGKRDLSHLGGTWTDQEVSNFETATKN